MKIVAATRNVGKLCELQTMLKDFPIKLLSLSDYPDCPEAPEAFSTYLENAREKAQLTAEYCQTWALADDSGLEIEALAWKPGVRSARYAGEAADAQKNNQKILHELRNVPASQRRAVFRCVLVLRSPRGEEFVTHGELWGWIATECRGAQGFGYDPVFTLESGGSSLAELGIEEKNKISHRTLALLEMKKNILGFNR